MEKVNSFTVVLSQNGRTEVFLSFLIVYISLVGSVTIANSQIEWS